MLEKKYADRLMVATSERELLTVLVEMLTDPAMSEIGGRLGEIAAQRRRELQPQPSADSATRFEAFTTALDALCAQHGIQLTTSMYDGLQAWPLREGDCPVYANGFENCIPDAP